jgi:hypothetical protein
VPPKVSDPVDYTTVIKHINAPTAQLWLYDSRSGAVLAKFDIAAAALSAR